MTATARLGTPKGTRARTTTVAFLEYDSTFGVLGDPSEALPGTENPRFLGRGAPFGIWVGLEVTDGS